jgi:hypothetical protein
MITRRTMGFIRRVLSSVLVAAGIVLVLAGLTSALGSGVTGLVASAALVSALLYAGGTWFAPPPPTAAASMLVLFDRSGRVVAGSRTGEPLGAYFSPRLGAEIDRHVSTVFAGASVHFVPDPRSATPLVMVPVRATDGTIPLAILTTAAAVSIALDAESVSAVV